MNKRPPYSIEGTLNLAVVSELEDLLDQARRGQLYGLAYVSVGRNNQIDAGSAGNLGRDHIKAVGALHLAVSLAETAAYEC